MLNDKIRTHASITARDITKAVVYADPAAQRRIEAYGAMNVQFLRDLTRQEPNVNRP